MQANAQALSRMKFGRCSCEDVPRCRHFISPHGVSLLSPTWRICGVRGSVERMRQACGVCKARRQPLLLAGSRWMRTSIPHLACLESAPQRLQLLLQRRRLRQGKKRAQGATPLVRAPCTHGSRGATAACWHLHASVLRAGHGGSKRSGPLPQRSPGKRTQARSRRRQTWGHTCMESTFCTQTTSAAVAWTDRFCPRHGQNGSRSRRPSRHRCRCRCCRADLPVGPVQLV